jgi:uncharacterized protein YqeY
MALKARINEDVKTAMLGGDRFAADVLRGLKAAILNEEVALGKRDEGLDDATIEQVIAREVKKRGESKLLYEQNGRPELAETEQREADILSLYLPTQLTEAEVQAVVTTVIAEVGATGPADMGRVIGAVKARVGTAASGAVIADVVKKSLN